MDNPFTRDAMVHAKILEKCGSEQAHAMILDIIFAYQNGHGPTNSEHFNNRLRDAVLKLCQNKSGLPDNYYQDLLHAARRENISGFLSSPVPSNVMSNSLARHHEPPMGSPLSHKRQTSQLQIPKRPSSSSSGCFSTFSPRTSPSTIFSWPEASREIIKVLDPNNTGTEHTFSVKYTGQNKDTLGLHFIMQKTLDTKFEYHKSTMCDELCVSHLDAPGPAHVFRTNRCTTLQWYRPEWRDQNDFSTETYTFYIVDDVISPEILLGNACPLPTREHSENGSYPCQASKGTGSAVITRLETILPQYHRGSYVPASSYQSHEQTQAQHPVFRPHQQTPPNAPLYDRVYQPQPQGFALPRAGTFDNRFNSGPGAPTTTQEPNPLQSYDLKSQSHAPIPPHIQNDASNPMKSYDPKSQSQAPLMPHLQKDVNATSGSAFGSVPAPNFQGPSPAQPVFNKPSPPDNNDNGKSLKTVSVDWHFGSTDLSWDFDLSNPSTELQDTMNEIFDDYLEMKVKEHSYKLEFRMPPSEKMTPFIFKMNDIEAHVNRIIAWLRTKADKQHFECTIIQRTGT